MTGIEIFAAASLAATAGGTIYSAQQQRKAAAAQGRIARLQEQRQRIEQNRARRETIRNARLAQAAVINSGANKGVQDSSGVQGGAGSVLSQANSELSFLDQVGQIADQTSIELGRVRKFQQRAATGQTVAQLGQIASTSSFGQAGQTALYERIFG